MVGPFELVKHCPSAIAANWHTGEKFYRGYPELENSFTP